MPIDLNRFIATFFDEAQEHMESIEEHAMALGRGGNNTETLNSIFRAAHSINVPSVIHGVSKLTVRVFQICRSPRVRTGTTKTARKI